MGDSGPLYFVSCGDWKYVMVSGQKCIFLATKLTKGGYLLPHTVWWPVYLNKYISILMLCYCSYNYYFVLSEFCTNCILMLWKQCSQNIHASKAHWNELTPVWVPKGYYSCASLLVSEMLLCWGPDMLTLKVHHLHLLMWNLKHQQFEMATQGKCT